MTTTRPAPAPVGNRWLVLTAMTCSLSMIMLDQTVVSVALPSIGRGLTGTAAGRGSPAASPVEGEDSGESRAERERLPARPA